VNYLAFAERTLTTVDELMSDPANANASMVALHEVATRFVADHMSSRATAADSPLAQALGDVADDLAAIGLMKQESSLFVSLTARGRLAAAGGLSREWPKIVDALPLTSAALTFLRATCTVCEWRDERWAGMARTDSDRVVRELGGPWTPARLVDVWTELEEAGAVTGVLVSGPPTIVGLRPTYLGMVLATAGPAAKLQQLVRMLIDDWEGATVDHKVRLEIASPTQKAELARDIAALANTQARGQRYLVVGFDNTTHEFAESFDAAMTQDRLEDILGTRLSTVPGIRVSIVAWPGGQVGLIEVIRERLHLPYRITGDLSAKVRDGTVNVRHGSHVAIAEDAEISELEEEARRVREGAV
jgi:hypothetical protein